MQRCCWTLVVLIGSSSRPPSRSVRSSRIASSTTNRSDPSGRRTRRPAAPTDVFEADVRGEPREEHAVRREHAPHLLDHPIEMREVSREVQHGAADDRVHARRRPTAGDRSRRSRKFCDGSSGASLAASAWTCSIAAGSRSMPKHVKPRAEQVDQVAAVAAAGIEHARPAIEAAAQQLIEQIDVDLAERRRQLDARRRDRPRPSAQAGRQAGRREQADELLPPLRRLRRRRRPATRRTASRDPCRGCS